MAQHRITVARTVEGEPEVLAAPVHGRYPRSAEACTKIPGTAGVVADGSGIEHGHTGDGSAGDVRGKPPADYLDFGQLRHGRRSRARRERKSTRLNSSHVAI